MSARRTAEEIVDAIEHAARALFIQRTPAAVSLREIAANAGVNLGQIHRYVGSKDDVVRLVLRRHTDRMQQLVDSAEGSAQDLFTAAAQFSVRSPESGPLFAGLLLDGLDVRDLKREFPVFERLEELGVGKTQAAVALSAILGWEIFGRALSQAFDRELDHDEIVKALSSYLDHLLPS